MPSTKHFVSVAGNIAAGKSSLARLIADRLGWHAWFESVDDNPYLADFYRNMHRWSFHLQMYFLGHRAEHHVRLADHPKSVIQDRSLYEDRYIFAPALNHLGNLSDRDFKTYVQLYDQVVDQLPPPALLIYLRASVPTLLERIRRRGRDMESGITAAYLGLLNELYEQWIPDFDLCPVLTIRADQLDFVHSRQHLNTVGRTNHGSAVGPGRGSLLSPGMVDSAWVHPRT